MGRLVDLRDKRFGGLVVVNRAEGCEGGERHGCVNAIVETPKLLWRVT